GRPRAAAPRRRLGLLGRRRRHRPAPPAPTCRRDELLRAARALGPADVEQLELALPVAEAEADLEPTAAQLVDDGDVLGEPDRVLEGPEQDRRSEPHPRRAC